MLSKDKQRTELNKSTSMLPKKATGARKFRLHVKMRTTTKDFTGFEALELPVARQRAISPATSQSMTFTKTTKLLEYVRALNLSQKFRNSLTKIESELIPTTKWHTKTNHATIRNLSGMIITKKPLNRPDSSLLQDQQTRIRIPVAAFNQEIPTQLNLQAPCRTAMHCKRPAHHSTHCSNYSIINLNFSVPEKVPPQRTKNPQRNWAT